MLRPPTRAEEPSAPPSVAAGGLLGTLVRIPTFHALSYPEFRLLWLGQAGTGMGTWMDQVARGWLMYELTNSPLQLGLVRASQALPFLLLSPVAGTLADRYDRKAQLVLSQSIDAALYVLMAVLIFTGNIQPWHVYATALAMATVQVFQHPPRQAMISEVVAPRHLTNAIALNSVVFNLSRSLGPAVAGVLIALTGTGGSYVAQALLYVLATFWTIQLPASASRPAPQGGHGARAPSFIGSTVEGWRFIQRSETVRTAILISMLASLLAMPFTILLPVFARDILGAGPTGQGLLLTSMGMGALCSAILVASFADRLPRGILMVGGTALYGLAILAFSASSWFGLSLLLMVIVGLFHVTTHALVQTVVMAYSPGELRGRVTGVFMQNQVVMTAGSMAAGALASAWGAQWAAGSMAGLCALSAAAIYFAMPSARSIR